MYRSDLRKLECALERPQRDAMWRMLGLAASVERTASEGWRPQMLAPHPWFQQSPEVLSAAAILLIAPALAPVQEKVSRLRKTHAGAPCPCGVQRSRCEACKGVRCGGIGDCSRHRRSLCSLCRVPTRSLCSKPAEVQRRLRYRLQKLEGTAPPSASVPPASGPPPASVPAAGPQTHMCLRSRTSSARAPELKAGSEADSEADSEEKGEEEEGCEEGAQAGGEESGDESGDPSAATPAIAPAVTAITPAATAPAAFTATTPAFATLLLAVEASARKDEAALAEMVPPAEEEVAMDDAGVMEVEVVWDGELDGGMDVEMAAADAAVAVEAAAAAEVLRVDAEAAAAAEAQRVDAEAAAAAEVLRVDAEAAQALLLPPTLAIILTLALSISLSPSPALTLALALALTLNPATDPAGVGPRHLGRGRPQRLQPR